MTIKISKNCHSDLIVGKFQIRILRNIGSGLLPGFQELYYQKKLKDKSAKGLSVR